MKQIKTFRFRVSNAAYICFDEDRKEKWFSAYDNELQDPYDIDTTINMWMNRVQNPQLISVTPVTAHRHNNARGDTVDLYYTFSYED